MQTGEIERLRQQLASRAEELKATIAAGEQADAPIAPDSSLGRLTRVDALQAQQMAQALVQRNREELGRVTRALERIEAGTYGVCARCGEDIAEARLQAVPDAVVCRDCAEKRSAR
jgi:DnaK suppressor protein